MILVLNKNKNERLMRELNTLKEYISLKEEYYSVLYEKDEKMRKFRHDIKNHIFCMHTLFQNKEYKELDRYFNTLDEDLKEISFQFNTGNKLINAIINDLTHRYKSVSVQCTGKMPDYIGISAIDVCTIFSNILCNAFEASSKSNIKTVDVNIAIVNLNLVVTVKNTSDTAPVIHKDRYITSKKTDGHGYGIEIIRNCIKKNNGVLQLNYDDGIFCSKVALFGILKD